MGRVEPVVGPRALVSGHKEGASRRKRSYSRYESDYLTGRREPTAMRGAEFAETLKRCCKFVVIQSRSRRGPDSERSVRRPVCTPLCVQIEPNECNEPSLHR
jgi:hypothetical protein